MQKKEGVVKFDPSCRLTWGQVSGVVACALKVGTLRSNENLRELESCLTYNCDIAPALIKQNPKRLIETIDRKFFEDVAVWLEQTGFENYLEEDGSLNPEGFNNIANFMADGGAICQNNVLAA